MNRLKGSVESSGRLISVFRRHINDLCILILQIHSELEAFEEGHGKNVYFEGEVIKPLVELNWRWYDSIEGFRTEALIDSFVIKETNFKRNKDIIYIGVLFIAMAVLRFLSAGGIKSFVMEETMDKKPVCNYDTETGKSGRRRK